MTDFLVNANARWEARRDREDALRIKHGIGMATSLSYGLLASSVWTPLFQQHALAGGNVVGLLIAFVVLGLTFLALPYGEYLEPD